MLLTRKLCFLQGDSVTIQLQVYGIFPDARRTMKWSRRVTIIENGMVNVAIKVMVWHHVIVIWRGLVC
jgi:hypothetical protein